MLPIQIQWPSIGSPTTSPIRASGAEAEGGCEGERQAEESSDVNGWVNPDPDPSKSLRVRVRVRTVKSWIRTRTQTRTRRYANLNFFFLIYGITCNYYIYSRMMKIFNLILKTFIA